MKLFNEDNILMVKERPKARHCDETYITIHSKSDEELYLFQQTILNYQELVNKMKGLFEQQPEIFLLFPQDIIDSMKGITKAGVGE